MAAPTKDIVCSEARTDFVGDGRINLARAAGDIICRPPVRITVQRGFIQQLRVIF